MASFRRQMDANSEEVLGNAHVARMMILDLREIAEARIYRPEANSGVPGV
jgi:hypothetical protein